MKTTPLLAALIVFLPLCCVAKDRKTNQAAVAARQEESYRQAVGEFPEMKDTNSALFKEVQRLIEEYKKVDDKILKDEQSPRRIVREAAANVEAARARSALKTLSGSTYKDVTVTRIEPNGISIAHADGLAKILFDDLPEEMRTKYGYDPVKAAAFTETEKAAAAQRAVADAARQALQIQQVGESQVQQPPTPAPKAPQEDLTVEQMQQLVELAKKIQELRNLQQPQQDQTLQYLELIKQLKGMTHSGQIKQRRIDREIEWNDPVNKLRRDVEELKRQQR